MGKRTRQREAERHAADQALAARLRQTTRRNCSPGFITTYGQFPLEYQARFEPYRNEAIRDPDHWRSALRVRSPELRFLEFIRYAFSSFAVGACLEREWLPCAETGNGDTPIPDFRAWYVTAARGGSLYRERARYFLSRPETHQFLAAPEKVGSAKAALWYAVVMAETGDATGAMQVVRSNLVERDIRDPFWKEAARYFARHRTSAQEIGDLAAYLAAAREADPGFSLAGRSLSALRRRRQDWLRLTQAGAAYGNLRWGGATLPDAVYEVDGVLWRFSQIRSAIRLLEEGEKMHHCVFIYRGGCANGDCSIWSVGVEAGGSWRRRLTLEVSPQGFVMQCRGVLNRDPTPAEAQVVRRWMGENGLRWFYDQLEEAV